MELFGLLLALFAILIVVSKFKKIPPAIILGIIIIILTSSMKIGEAFSIFIKYAFRWNTIELVIIILLITLLASLMHKTNMLKAVLDSLLILFRSVHFLTGLIPMLVGILPSPAGALLSAPFIDELGDKIKMSPGSKSAVNVYFRYLLVFLNPISPILIIAVDISEIGFLPFIKFNALPILFAFLIGLFIVKRYWSISEETVIPEKSSGEVIKKTLLKLIISASPIILAVILTLNFSVKLIISLLIGILLLIIIDFLHEKNLDKYQKGPLFFKSVNWGLGLSAFMLLLLEGYIKNSAGLTQFGNILVNIQIPFIPLLILTSIIIGFSSGHPIVSIAVVYPIFLPIIGTGPESNIYLPLILNGLMFGYIISPINLTLIVSNEYFKTDYKKIYPLLITLQTIALTVAILWALILL